MLRRQLLMKFAVALLVFGACRTLALAADNIDDFWPAEQALSNCGREYVRGGTAPTVAGAQARCAAEFERYMKVVATMTRLSQPRMGGPTPEWEEQVKTAVARKRISIRDDFAQSVKNWIAERQR
jgi:hypothetical protein